MTGTTRRPAPRDLSHTTDSAGQAWAERTLRANPFAGDDGTVLPATERALTEKDASQRPVQLVRALRTERVLVPVVAHEHPGTEQVTDAEGKTRTVAASHIKHGSDDPAGDACASAAMVSVRTRDGRSALPVFSSVSAMKAWNADARPVPVESPRAAQAAAAEADGLLVIDAGSEQPVLLGRPAVQALGTGEEWLAPWQDDQLVGHLISLLRPIQGLLGVRLEGGRDAETRVLLAVDARLDRSAATASVHDAQQRIAADDTLRARIDSLELTPVAVSADT